MSCTYRQDVEATHRSTARKFLTRRKHRLLVWVGWYVCDRIRSARAFRIHIYVQVLVQSEYHGTTARSTFKDKRKTLTVKIDCDSEKAVTLLIQFHHRRLSMIENERVLAGIISEVHQIVST